jgi:hypothetical protein
MKNLQREAGHLDLSSIVAFLGNADPRQFGENVALLVAARWILMGMLKGHLEQIQVQLTKVASSVAELQVTLTRIETDHSLRLAHLEDEIKELKD